VYYSAAIFDGWMALLARPLSTRLAMRSVRT
jgi:hypothetical protein